MDSDGLNDLLRAARQAAGTLSPDPQASDARGNTQGDYETLLFWRSYMEQAETRLEGEAQRLWLYKTTWNAVRDMRRRRQSAARHAPEEFTALHAASIPDPAPCMARVVEDRALVEFLSQKMPPDEWALLQRVSDANSVRDAYSPDLGMSLRTFYGRVRAAQERARRIVDAAMRC